MFNLEKMFNIGKCLIEEKVELWQKERKLWTNLNHTTTLFSDKKELRNHRDS